MNTTEVTERILSIIESHGFTTDVPGAAHQLKIEIQQELETSYQQGVSENFDFVSNDYEPF